MSKHFFAALDWLFFPVMVFVSTLILIGGLVVCYARLGWRVALGLGYSLRYMHQTWVTHVKDCFRSWRDAVALEYAGLKSS